MSHGYRSAQTWRGIPVIHIAFGGRSDGAYRVARARGVIAIGDIATGVIAVGPVAVGIVAAAVVAAGVVAVGLHVASAFYSG